MTNTYEPVYTSIVVNKLWDDNSDQDGMRDDASATLQLTADGDELGDPVVVEYGKDNKWTYTFDNLQVYSDANKTPIVYTVIEILPDGSVYTKTGDGEEITATTDEISGTVDITNTHTPETVKITVKKVWDDDDNRDGIRPDSVEVTLTSITDSEEEETITDVQKLNDSNKWAYEWLELPKYRNGELINYAIAETKTDVVTGVDGIGTYAIVIEQNGEVGEDIDFVVTNPHTPEVIVIKVEKIWEDQDNQDNVRPTQLTVYLLVDGEQIDSIVLNEANEWKGEFSKQPAFEKGKEISYTVAEEDLGDIYEAVIEGDARNGFTITNFYSPKGGEDVPPGPPVPKTGDNIVLYIISLILGIIGLGYSIYLKKSFN